MKSVSGGRNPATTQEVTNLPVNQPLDVDNMMAIEADPGPFKIAAPDKLEAFSPVLVIIPDEGGIDVVIVELSPLHV
jgi:hypothetical protein